jgi:hypothetical protein
MMGGTVLLNNDRLSHWLAAAVLSWTAFLLLLFIPIFHLLLGFPISKIAVSAGICCAVQFAVTPWYFPLALHARTQVAELSGALWWRLFGCH